MQYIIRQINALWFIGEKPIINEEKALLNYQILFETLCTVLPIYLLLLGGIFFLIRTV